MIPGIVTLVVGVVIVIISFFLGDGKKEDTSENLLAENREKLEKQLDEYCDLLVEKKKNDLKKQGEEVKNNMKKGLDEVKSTSKKELSEINDASKKDIEEFRENSRKEIDEYRENVKADIDKAMKSYQNSLAEARKNMESELQACSSQLSEKAKKQMIDYINQSLTEAYEAYDPDDTSEKEPITYDEELAADDADATDPAADDADVIEPAAEEEAQEAEVTENAEEAVIQNTEKAEQTAEDAEKVTEEPVQEADASVEKQEDVVVETDIATADEAAAETVVSVEESPVSDSAFTVVEAENPEKMAAAIEEGNVVPAPQKNRNNRSRKKKKKKSAQNAPIDIWDEGVDIETQVADLHKKGLSIMEIANKLGIGVGEAKIMIDQISETKETDRQ